MNKTLVIIPNYNNLKMLEKCLMCLDRQDTLDFDTIVVDNGSEDNVIEFLNGWHNKDSRNHIIYFDSNCGFAKACNEGFKFSIEKGYRYSILLNNDAFVEKGFIYNLTNSIEEEKNCFAVNSLMLSYKDPDIIDDMGDNYTILGYAYQNNVGLKKEKYALKDERCFSACGGASIYDNYILEKTGGLDESFFAYLEDIDLSYRANLLGYKVKTCIKAICYHVGSATSGSKYNQFKVKLSSRNNIFLLYKNMPPLQILVNIFPLFVGTFVKFLFFLFKGFGIDYVKGIYEGFNNLYRVEKFNFKKVPFYRFIILEYRFIYWTFVYIKNFLDRRFNK